MPANHTLVSILLLLAVLPLTFRSLYFIFPSISKLAADSFFRKSHAQNFELGTMLNSKFIYKNTLNALIGRLFWISSRSRL